MDDARKVLLHTLNVFNDSVVFMLFIPLFILFLFIIVGVIVVVDIVIALVVVLVARKLL